MPASASIRNVDGRVDGIRVQSSEPVVMLPFAARGGRGMVEVRYGVTDDAVAVGEASVSVDVAPFLASEDSPLAFFGHLPTLFDAAANPDHPDGDWVAESFPRRRTRHRAN